MNDKVKAKKEFTKLYIELCSFYDYPKRVKKRSGIQNYG